VSLHGDEVIYWSEISLPEDVDRSGSIRDPDLVSSRLRQIIQQENLATRNVVIAIAGHRTIFRSMVFPAMEQDLLNSAVQRKIRQEIPLPEGEMDLSWSIISQNETEISTFIVAVPRIIIDSHMKALELADLKPKAMDIGPLALLRTVNRENAIICNLEHGNLSVVILQNKIPAIVRTVPIGSQATSPEGRLELLAQELGRTTKFYNESHKDQPLADSTPVLATGSHFNEFSMLERFSRLSPYPVRLPQPPFKYPTDFPMPQYAINLGLGLKEL
jgi:type II secretory pathway component PulL